MKSLDGEGFMARLQAQRIIEELLVTRTVLVGNESFNGWPIWAVSASFGEEWSQSRLVLKLLRQGKKERERCDCMRHVSMCLMAVIWGGGSRFCGGVELSY